jgi:hypothetical protein
MSTFSDLPRYPAHSTDAPDGPAEFEGGIRGAVAIAQTAGELLFIASPLFACLWWIVCLPILLALLLATATRDDRR